MALLNFLHSFPICKHNSLENKINKITMRPTFCLQVQYCGYGAFNILPDPVRFKTMQKQYYIFGYKKLYGLI